MDTDRFPNLRAFPTFDAAMTFVVHNGIAWMIETVYGIVDNIQPVGTAFVVLDPSVLIPPVVAPDDPVNPVVAPDDPVNPQGDE